MKTLKQEEAYRNEYRAFRDARSSIREFLERVYNKKRLHSALGYLRLLPSSSRTAVKHEVAAQLFALGLGPQAPRDLPLFPPE